MDLNLKNHRQLPKSTGKKYTLPISLIRNNRIANYFTKKPIVIQNINKPTGPQEISELIASQLGK
jgi:hypothetical protein